MREKNQKISDLEKLKKFPIQFLYGNFRNFSKLTCDYPTSGNKSDDYDYVKLSRHIDRTFNFGSICGIFITIGGH